MRYQVIEDNGGGLSLIVFRGKKVIFSHSGYEYNQGNLTADLDALDGGDDTKSWEGNSETPQSDYDKLTSYEYGWKIVASGSNGNRKLLKANMGRAAQLEFSVSDEDRDLAIAASKMGSIKTKKKARSSAENGKRGGRPKKVV
jgi:hypothetical protein